MTPLDPEPRSGFRLVKIAEHQPEYETLPANINGTSVETKWKLTWSERLQCIFSGNIYLTIMNFGAPLQPIRMSVLREPEWE
jgi:hypothetical protein